MALLALSLLAAALVGTGTQSDTLHEQILQADSQLFAAAFDQCDAAKAANMTTQDMEFFHDKGGKSSSNRAEFAHSIATICQDQQSGDRPRLRRALQGTPQVFPMQQDRALEIGTHRFYQRSRDGHERVSGEARFVHLWRNVEGDWQLERVISYDHQPLHE